MKPVTLDAGSVLRHTLRLMRSNAVGAGAAVLLLTAVGSASELLPGAAAPLILVSTGLGIAFQGRLTSSALRLAGREGDPGSRFGGVFFISLLANLAILFGLILLVIPGLYLFARWAVAVPVLIEENRGPRDALRGSWERTEGHVLPIIVTFIPVYLPVLAFIALDIAFGLFEYSEPVTSLALNLAFELSLVAGWHAAVAIYVALVPDDGIAEIFS